MATRLIFPSDEALQLALTGGLIPAKAQAKPVRAQRHEDGTITVEPGRSLSRQQLKELSNVGVEVTRGGQDDDLHLREARCWAEVLPPTRLSGDELSTALVLFALPSGATLLPLAAELLRLGCDRQDVCFLEDRTDGVEALLKAQTPPYYTLARALERPEGVRAYTPAPPGQERVWTELGFDHPLARSVHPPEQGMLLITDDSWRTLPAGPWTNLYQLIDVQLPASGAAHLPTEMTEIERLRVTLQLRPLAREVPPTLWVLHENAVEIVDGLVQQLPEHEIKRLLFTATGDAERPVVLLRAREGRGTPPLLEISAVALAQYLEIKNLYLPCDAILEPPLRRETLRELLAPRTEEITWLTPDPDADPAAFSVERIADDAFSPLEDWVDYVVHTSAAQLEPWVHAQLFELDAFESVGVEWSERPAVAPAPEPERPRGQRKRSRQRPEVAEEVAVYATEVADTDEEPTGEPELAPIAAIDLTPGSEDEQTLAELERRFLDMDSPAEAPERGEIWLQMARLNTTLDRQRDAGLCWTRALWEADGQQARTIAQHWSVAESMLLGHRTGGGASLVTALLKKKRPTPQQARALASQLLRVTISQEPPPPPERLHAIQVWLDAHDEGLDVRSLWLARLALSQMVGSDALQLTRTRDRILARLFRGLSLEQDVPTFLRFCGGGPGADTTTVGQLAEQLEALLGQFHKAKRKRSAVEAPPELTQAYVELLFAYGFARLGQSDRARSLRQQAIAALPAGDKIHGFLRQAYGARIEHALEGMPAETPLPSDISGQLNELERFVRYKVDRLRQASFILEPHEHLDPILAFQQAKRDPRGEEFAPMRGMTDPKEISRAVDEVMRKAVDSGTSIEDRDRLFDGVMDFFPMLPESESVPYLRTLVESVEPISLPRRCMLLQEALMLGGFFGRSELVQELVERLKQLIGELGGEHVAEVASTLGQCLRSMRRVGLADEASELLSAVGAAVEGTGTSVVVARLQLASGWADIGRLDQAQGLMQEGTKALKDKTLLPVDRLEVTRALAGAASHLPLGQAIAELQRLATQLPQISDSFNTNSHFCLSVIQFMEALILGYASEQLALGQLGRRWLDEDEYLVRRRVHRDMSVQA